MMRRPLVLALLAALLTTSTQAQTPAEKIFARDNLIAWCIVPFDAKKRGPEERAAMLQRLGFKHFAYDWRAEHITTFNDEIRALKRHGVALDAFWVAPGQETPESALILETLLGHKVKADLWALLDLGLDKSSGAEQERRLSLAVGKLKGLAESAQAVGCRVALYNHGGWFGEPENQVAIVRRLREVHGLDNVGIVYNLHHGHAHLDRLPAVLKLITPYLWTINLNGMDRDGEARGRKILPLGQGECDLTVLKQILDSGYKGPIGILGHTQDDAEARLQDNLDGLDWLVPQLDNKPAGPRPTPRTPVPGGARMSGLNPAESEAVAKLIAEARSEGDAKRGAEVFASTRFACLSCHRVGDQGGTVGPDLSIVGACSTAEHLVGSLLWPKREVFPGYEAMAVEAKDGQVYQGYKQGESAKGLTLREAASGRVVTLPRSQIEGTRNLGTLMPDGLADAMTPAERRDVVRFLMDLGRPGAGHVAVREHRAGTFPFVRDPIYPGRWPSWRHHVNRDRVYDFYAKEAEYYRAQADLPALLPQYPGLDSGLYGHWGNQDEKVWADGRWNEADLGSVLCGVFRGAGVTVPKGVCVRLGGAPDLAICFNPQTLNYEVIWSGGFVGFSDVRHGFMDGLQMKGRLVTRDQAKAPERFVYHGFYRHADRVAFAYRLGDVEMLDVPGVEGGGFRREFGPREGHRLAHFTKGGPAQWPEVYETKGKLGTTRPYAVDTIEPPFDNRWKVPLFFGDHDFTPDGTAYVCTMQGDVWRVEGIDSNLEHVRWKRFASGLFQALGLVVVDGKPVVLGRDQITRLHDLNDDGEADFYECVSNAYETSPAGHDFICGLQRDASGNFYTVSGKQGLIRISPDGKTVTVLATGFRNPDGLGLTPQGVITVPSSEGDWTPASMVAEVRPGDHYGYGGPKDGKPPALPLVYLPRGLDNSSGAQAYVDSDRWGPLRGQMVHLSFGAGTDFLLLRESVDGQPQGAVVPLNDEFLSGSHRGRFNPKDGQLYVSGQAGWGTYTPLDGSFQRVRYTGDPVQLPVAYHVHENGVLLTFTRPVDRALAEDPRSHFAQAWNYRYGSSYGSPEFSTRHAGTPGHDPLAIRSAHVLDDGKTLFVEIPEIQPVSQLHLHLKVGPGDPVDVFGTVHKLAAPFTGFPGYRPEKKVIATHPILADLAMATKAVPNPWKRKLPNARNITIEAGKNLTFTRPSFTVKAGEPIVLTFLNPDVVPHNWTLAKPGSLARVGDLANRLVADPDAAARQYVPKSDDVIAYTDVVAPGDQFVISFRAPKEPGKYPYLCTFPGHWMVMNGVMVVE